MRRRYRVCRTATRQAQRPATGIHSTVLRPPTGSQVRTMPVAQTGLDHSSDPPPEYKATTNAKTAVARVTTWGRENPRITPRRVSRENLTGDNAKGRAASE